MIHLPMMTLTQGCRNEGGETTGWLERLLLLDLNLDFRSTKVAPEAKECGTLSLMTKKTRITYQRGDQHGIQASPHPRNRQGQQLLPVDAMLNRDLVACTVRLCLWTSGKS